jgi:hypothetical protein
MLLLCPICASEYEVEMLLCPGCGVKLVAGSLEDSDSSQAEQNRTPQMEFVELCRPRGYSIAMLIKETLEQNGVTALVQGGHSMSVLPSLPFLGELRILVPRPQLDYARELYDAYFGAGGEDEEEGDEDGEAEG